MWLIIQSAPPVYKFLDLPISFARLFMYDSVLKLSSHSWFRFFSLCVPVWCWFSLGITCFHLLCFVFPFGSLAMFYLTKWFLYQLSEREARFLLSSFWNCMWIVCLNWAGHRTIWQTMDTADRGLLLQRAEKVLSSRRSLFSSINIPEEIQRKLKPTVLVIFSKLRFLEYPHVTDGCLLCSFWNILVTFEANDGLLSSQAPSLQFVGSSLLASFLWACKESFSFPS